MGAFMNERRVVERVERDSRREGTDCSGQKVGQARRAAE